MDSQANLFGRKCANVLPSPPESPSMYAYPPALGEHGRYTTRLAARHILTAPSSIAILRLAESTRKSGDEEALASQSQEESQRGGPTPPQSSSLHQITTVEHSSSVSSNMTSPEIPLFDQVSNPLGRDPPKQRPTRAHSTASHPAPQGVLTEAEHQSDGDELFTGSEEEEDVARVMQTVKSGAERLAEKRKMKRFRLTHAQTRYLMSEFSRQAHPDAAQRERLSRDIPGLNPRQVQVWFQNRRAKLKRLTSDDQERIRRSRALPEDFDFSQTLHPPFREPRLLYGSTLTDPSMLGGGMSQRPSLRLGTGHLSMASNDVNSAFRNNALSPGSTTGSAHHSPVSPIDERTERSGPYFSATQSSLATSPYSTNPLGRSHSLSVGSSAFQRQDRPSHQNSRTDLGGERVVTSSPSNPPFASSTYDYGNFAQPQLTRAPFQTRDGARFGRVPASEELSHESGTAMNQLYISPLSSPSSQSYDQSQILDPSGSGYRASSYYQGPGTNLWQGSQMGSQGYQYGQQLPSHRTHERRRGSPLPQSPLSSVPSVHRYDQRSYRHSGEIYSRVSSSCDAPQLPALLGEEAASTQSRPDATRPRARSDIFPAYYNGQS